MAEEKEMDTEEIIEENVDIKKEKEVKKKPRLKKTDKKDKVIAELEEKLLRVQAEFENFKRRSKTELEEMARFGAENMVLQILPVLDNFERALKIKPTKETVDNFYVGMDMIEKQLLEALNCQGLEKIEAVGQEFDPNFHDGVMNEPVVDDALANTVIDELQTGYLLNKKVVRPSMVKVGIKE
ncbi:hypothetical protein AZF37_05220 [endosymbiont 'TC1' of Trimyema compressum]|uniref:nucleotide exchange factor GrpE n=1 Tax=endosymbiont 'TC1' of Trimyema compressum TaxID=243899 RepID=UPI0007F0C2EE|nr:nucleotide exchange factor GrpE [endosymbiont 'TC1' of Trimyema compressum]AMP20659.1 hypothetical protein AZF37_05220 [endosymbiont 'TC1' of Trimyema compressum]